MRLRLLLVCAGITVVSQAHTQTPEQADKLARMPLKCVNTEYPNKLGQTLGSPDDLATPKTLHPAFYGCFDWHSAVHGHWSLVYLVEKFPKLASRDSLIRLLETHISRENITMELEYFKRRLEKTYERTYGWAWVLKLQQALDNSREQRLKDLAVNLQPLTSFLCNAYVAFLPKLLYPLRVGTHTNTAFGLSFAWDYAVHSNNTVLQKVISESAFRFYNKDEDCPFKWEPSGNDFLSPCLEEINLMLRILPEKDFLKWLRKFAPVLFNKIFEMPVAKVGDREDGLLVHLDGLNFSRAWAFYALAKKFPQQFAHLKPLAEKHFTTSFSKIFDGNYEGEHWLATFALHALEEK